MRAALLRWFDRTFVASVRASSEALFPADGVHPDHLDTDLADRTEAYVRALPPSQSPLVMLMFVAVEWLTPVLSPFGPRFSRRTPDERLALVDRWRSARLIPLRLFGDALRATLVMLYFSHPAAMASVGEPVEGEPLLDGP